MAWSAPIDQAASFLICRGSSNYRNDSLFTFLYPENAGSDLFKVVVKGLAFWLKLGFLICLIPLADSWIAERRLLPSPSKMKINFLGLDKNSDDEKFEFIITIDSRRKDIKVKVPFAQFKVLLDLALDKSKNKSKSGCNLSESEDKNLRRAKAPIADHIMSAERLTTVEDINVQIAKNPKIAKQKERLTEALGTILFSKTKGNMQIRIPENNISYSEDIIYSFYRVMDKKFDGSPGSIEGIKESINDLSLILQLDKNDDVLVAAKEIAYSKIEEKQESIKAQRKKEG
ncbi:MAG: hypothetical protein R3B47_12575 [Bacteroidia bacterium]